MKSLPVSAPKQKLLVFFLLYQTHFSVTSAVRHLFGGVRADVCRHEDCTQLSVASPSRLLRLHNTADSYFTLFLFPASADSLFLAVPLNVNFTNRC